MGLDCLAAGILVADHLCAPVDHLPAAGELVLADELPLSIGGCAANAAIDLARLEVKTGIAGVVGRDPFGRFVADVLESAGVDCGGLGWRDDVATSGTLIVNVQGEDRRFIHCLGANADFRVADIPLDLAKAAKIFYLGGYLLMPELDPGGLADLLKQIRAAGVTTVVDVVVPDDRDHWPNVEPLLPHTDVFLPNDDESARLTGLADPVAAAQRFVDAGAATAVITCGEKGTVLVNRSQRLRAGTYPMDYVGGTGAGDAFDAGYIVGLLRGEDEAGCLRWGSALGASCVRHVSATEGVFTRSQAEAFIKSQPLEIETITDV